MHAKDLNWHDGPVLWSRDMGDTEASPADDVGVDNVLIAVDPGLKTEGILSWILVDVKLRWVNLLLGVRCDKHLSIVSFCH